KSSQKPPESHRAFNPSTPFRQSYAITTENITIAVIGLGPAGLTALKCLREEGFNAVGLERRDSIGGLWSLSSQAEFTSVLDGTVTNLSKFITGFSDYPLPQGEEIISASPPLQHSDFLNSAQAAEYFESYALHFGLHQHVRFRTTVRKVLRNQQDTAWDVQIADAKGDESIASFDKVVFCHGCETVPVLPPMPNRDKFEGTVIHSQAYRNPSPFKDKRVLVVGNGAIANEISLALSKHATKVFQAYRRGRAAYSRRGPDGLPSDAQSSWPNLQLKHLPDHHVPCLTRPLADRDMQARMVRDAAKSEPDRVGESEFERRRHAEQRMRIDWHLLPCASMAHVHPVVQDDFVLALRRGDVIPVRGFKDFIGKTRVLLTDDAVVDVDAVIFYTGYGTDFGIMPELEMDGTCGLPLRRADEVGGNRSSAAVNYGIASDCLNGTPHIPRLFQMMFPPLRASSIAFISWMATQEASWSVSELASMAVAQIWAAETAESLGSSKRHRSSAGTKHRPPALLPSLDQMNAQVDQYHAWWRQKWNKEHAMRPGHVQAHRFYRFLHAAAGTGLDENLGHALSFRYWRLRWRDPELWAWLARGPLNNNALRVFETNPDAVPGCGRRAWPGARGALQHAYEYYQEYKKQKRDECDANRTEVT
ncbi:uncharacterized protein PG986_008770, partial [Apiospora aurea]